MTRGGWGGDTPGLPATTTLEMVNAQAGKAVSSMTVPGQASSAVPYGNSVVAAYGRGITQFGANGHNTTLATVSGVPFRLAPDPSGGIGYQVVKGSNVELYQVAGGRAALLGSAPQRSVEDRRERRQAVADGTGRHPAQGAAGGVAGGGCARGVSDVNDGCRAVTDVSNGAPVGGTRASPAAALPEKITAQVLSGGRPRVSFTVPAAAAGPVPLTVSGPADGRADRSQAAPRRIATPGPRLPRGQTRARRPRRPTQPAPSPSTIPRCRPRSRISSRLSGPPTRPCTVT